MTFEKVLNICHNLIVNNVEESTSRERERESLSSPVRSSAQDVSVCCF